MYHVEKININPENALFEFCDTITNVSKNMYNVAYFYIRNTMTGLSKEAAKRTTNEAEVLRIVQDGINAHNEKALKKQTDQKKAAGKSTDKVELEAAKMPAEYNGCLHMFTEENPVMIDNEAYSYRSDNEGMYLYWKGDTSAFTASSFGTGGTIALSAVGGLIVGIAGATAVLLPKKKKEQEPEPAKA